MKHQLIHKRCKDIQSFFIKNNIFREQTKSNLYLLRTIQIINKIKKYYPKKEISILDIGCGEGYNTCLMDSIIINSKITGIDYRKHYKKYWKLINKNGYKIRFITSDARKIPSDKEFFDIIIMWGVLEHIGEDKKTNKEKRIEEKLCIKEIYRLLKPEGLLMINYLPNKFSYIEFIAKYLNLYNHLKKFSKKEIIELLYENNFEIIDIKYVHFIPSLYFHLGKKIGDIFNTGYKLLDFLDKILLKTPIKFFAQDLEVVVRKI